MVAIDYSERLLEFASERTPHDLQIEYRHANFEKLDLFGAESFDLVVSVAALNDIADYESAVREAYRVLVRGEAVLLALLHPCFSADGGWVRDAEGRKRHWKVDNYFREIASEQRLSRDAARQPLYFHRTLTSYFRTLLSSGFQIEALVEPHPSQAALEKFPEYADDLRMSHYLVLVLRKRPCR